MLYIEFEILSEQKFKEFLVIYALITKVSHREQPKPIDFWRNLIPDYSKQSFNLVDYHHPNYDPRKMDFMAMMDYLQMNLEVDYLTCKATEKGKGRLEFEPLSYPYGGMDRLIVFLKTFDCSATRIDSGFGIKTVKWNSKFHFICEKE